MSDTATCEKRIEFDLTVDDIAQAFCKMDDDAQAQFFVRVAARMHAWKRAGAADTQAHFIGKHLATCECSTHEARELVFGIAESIKEATDG